MSERSYHQQADPLVWRLVWQWKKADCFHCSLAGDIEVGYPCFHCHLAGEIVVWIARDWLVVVLNRG